MPSFSKHKPYTATYNVLQIPIPNILAQLELLSSTFCTLATVDTKLHYTMAPSKADVDAIGRQLLDVLPRDDVAWYRKPHLLRLNFSILSLVLFCMSTLLARTPLHPC